MFLCCQPLRVPVDCATVSAIDSSLQHHHDREDTMKALFNGARNIAVTHIADQLSDYRHSRTIGLNTMLSLLFAY